MPKERNVRTRLLRTRANGAHPGPSAAGGPASGAVGVHHRLADSERRATPPVATRRLRGARRPSRPAHQERQRPNFPLHDALEHLLEAQKAEHDRLKAEGVLCPWVFNRGGKKVKGKRIIRFTRAWRKACEKAGCPGRIPHDLRRTAVRNLVRAGIPKRVAMQMTGHKTRSVFERYNIVSECDLVEAAKKLNAIQPVQLPADSDPHGHNLGTIARQNDSRRSI